FSLLRFDTVNIPGFVHAEQFLSLSTRLATINIFGLGGEFRATLKHQFAKRKKLIMFARGENDVTANSFGVHPFHICMENDGMAHGIYFMNANA
uniref:Uncharacterized protein n=1 Tax=Romanomermis culicivorax TaxID=13658 RepID=A0A915JFB1_ROMCU